MMDSFCRPMLEQNDALGNKRLLLGGGGYFWEGAVTFGRGGYFRIFLHHQKKAVTFGGGLLSELYGIACMSLQTWTNIWTNKIDRLKTKTNEPTDNKH